VAAADDVAEARRRAAAVAAGVRIELVQQAASAR
jgi:hypothetical protein